MGILRDPTIDHRDRVFGQVTGGFGGPAADPRLHLTRTDPTPQARETVTQVQSIADQPFSGGRGGGQHDPELGRRELRHFRGAGTTEPDQLLTAGQHRARGPGELTVQVGPMSRRLQEPHLRLFSIPPRLLGGGQGGQLVECAEVGVEHVFDSTCHGRHPPARFALSTTLSGSQHRLRGTTWAGELNGRARHSLALNAGCGVPRWAGRSRSHATDVRSAAGSRNPARPLRLGPSARRR